MYISADDIADLNDRLIGLQQAKDAEKEHYEAEIQKLRNEFQETKDQLTSENMILSKLRDVSFKKVCFSFYPNLRNRNLYNVSLFLEVYCVFKSGDVYSHL